MFGFSTIIYRLVSSANSLTDAWSSFTMSLMWMRNYPKIDLFLEGKHK